MALSKSTRISILLAMNAVFFFIELIIGKLKSSQQQSPAGSDDSFKGTGSIPLHWLQMPFIWYVSLV